MSEGSHALLTNAVEVLSGGAVVLDKALRVVAATHAAERLLGTRIPLGARAIPLLCGEPTDHALAEALAAGRPIIVTAPRVDQSRSRVRIRATPLRAPNRTAGWLLLIAEEHASDDDVPEQFRGMWTRDVGMKGLFRLAAKVARSDTNILIEGEMGTGKASLASAVHALSARQHAPFRAVRCASARTELIEHHLADGGTLFFDDVAELSHDAQACLLRVLEGIVMPVDGGTGKGGPPEVDVRVIAATRTPLHREVDRGRFRADLMYRLRIVSLHLPPLRARRGDVALLVEKFIGELNEKGGRRIDRVAPAALVSLERHAWPGNVRELRACVESAFATGEGDVLVTADLPPEISEPFAPHEHAAATVLESRSSTADEAARLRRTLERAGGDRARAATMLGMSRTTLWRRMRALGLLEVDRRARQ